MLNTVSGPPMLACDDTMIEGWPKGVVPESPERSAFQWM